MSNETVAVTVAPTIKQAERYVSDLIQVTGSTCNVLWSETVGDATDVTVEITKDNGFLNIELADNVESVEYVSVVTE